MLRIRLWVTQSSSDTILGSQVGYRFQPSKQNLTQSPIGYRARLWKSQGTLGIVNVSWSFPTESGLCLSRSIFEILLSLFAYEKVSTRSKDESSDLHDWFLALFLPRRKICENCLQFSTDGEIFWQNKLEKSSRRNGLRKLRFPQYFFDAGKKVRWIFLIWK